jgi:adenosine deaminase
MPIYLFRGDVDAIERMAYELCEDEANDGVVYFELRYSPFFYTGVSTSGIKARNKTYVTPKMVVEAVNRGLGRGKHDFCIEVRTILSINSNHPNQAQETLELALEHQNNWVVGIDVAGPGNNPPTVPWSAQIISVFQEAKRRGLHRSVHAGEVGSPTRILVAIDELHAERIAHGYHAVADKEIYKTCLKRNIHFETCPYTSYLTGSVPVGILKHPVAIFAEDYFNFSISKCAPLLTHTTLDEEYELAQRLGLTDEQIWRAVT